MVDWQQYFLQGIELMFLGTGAYLDIKNRELPPEYFLAFGALGIICNMVWKYQSLKNIFIGVCIGGIFLFVGWITEEAIGYGDGLGLMILGLFEGWEGMIPMVFGAFLLGSVFGLWRIIGFRESGSDTIPFYPFLLLALIGVILL